MGIEKNGQNPFSSMVNDSHSPIEKIITPEKSIKDVCGGDPILGKNIYLGFLFFLFVIAHYFDPIINKEFYVDTRSVFEKAPFFGNFPKG